MDAIINFLKDYPIVQLLVTIGAVVGIVVLLNKFHFGKSVDSLDNVESSDVVMEEESPVPEQESAPSPMALSSEIDGSPVPDFTGEPIAPIDLLPSSQMAADFEKQFPVGTGDLSSKNFLTAGYNIGINTVASSLKNANLDLRSDPFIPVAEAGPWSQSTILPDLNRKTFEIGS